MKGIKVLGATAALLVSTTIANAIPISGEIHFAGLFTPIDSNGDAVNLGSSTGLDFVNPTAILVASGDFSSYVTPWVSTATFIETLSFNPLAPNPATLWTAGGFTFTLTAVQIVYQDNLQLNLLGTGSISGNGFDATVGTWNFQGGGSGFFTFRANDTAAGVAVPDGGNTLLLLGSTLLICGIASSAFRLRLKRVRA